MALRIQVSGARQLTDSVWAAELTPAEVRSLGRPTTQLGSRHIIGVLAPIASIDNTGLSVDPQELVVLNVGTGSNAVFVSLGASAAPLIEKSTKPASTTAQRPKAQETAPFQGRSDAYFIAECRRMLPPELCDMAQRLLEEIRRHYPGELREGLARKFVNWPHNFFALTIQNRDESFAVHIKGEPQQFSTKQIELKPDRGSYSRFKLSRQSQVPEAIEVILTSARRTVRQ